MAKKIFLSLLITFFLCSSAPKAQAAFHFLQTDTTKKYVPGKRYFFKIKGSSGEDLAIEYIAGDVGSKLILTSPHGGDLKPAYLHTRSKDFVVPAGDNDYGDTESFSAIADSKTLELTMGIAEEIKKLSGSRPHVILNHLHRSKMDANRAMATAAQGDPNAEAAWKAFHQYIDDAKAQVAKNGEGLVLDIHGNAHRPQRTEVGLLLKASDFTADDLEKFVAKSSIKAMVKPGKVTFTELAKGDFALGSLLTSKVFTATPANVNPLPADPVKFPDGKYFNGGYITARHGSKFGGNISAIQLEFNQDVRVDDKTRNGYVKPIADAIYTFMEKYFK